MADPLFKQGGYAPLVLPAVADWPTPTRADAGLDARRVDEAMAYHRAHETRWRPDFITERGVFVGVADEPERAGGVLGPIRPRGGPSGLIVRGGRLIAEWGESERVEMSFSIAKSYLAALAGVAVARGLIRGIDDPVCDYAIDDAFDSPQNQPITWRQLLQQTSELVGDDVRQAGHDRPQSRPRQGRLRTDGQGRAASDASARHAVGVQRRPRQPAEPLAVAAVSP